MVWVEVSTRQIISLLKLLFKENPISIRSEVVQLQKINHFKKILAYFLLVELLLHFRFYFHKSCVGVWLNFGPCRGLFSQVQALSQNLYQPTDKECATRAHFSSAHCSQLSLFIGSTELSTH